ncbi:MAG: hypothetical protein JOZ52_00435 [Acidobacteria bacterium]|nr:hypothetical protein [Acidobacteriota bacterium]
MKVLRRLLPYIIALVVLAAAWLWWNRPQKVDMAAYVPADSLVYLEADSLPEIASSLAHTDAWKALASNAGIKAGLGEVGWLSRLSSWTSIGTADAVVLSRAQVAVTVLGVEAADGGESLNVKPRIALVVETHTGAGRTRAAIENRVGNFARRAYGDPRVEERDADDAHWFTWSSATSDRRIIAATTGSLAVIGNDEQTVRACLAVRRGERASLAGNPELEEMRRRVLKSKDTLAFGYISTQGASQLFEVMAALYVGQMSQDAQTQSLAANILPQMARKILGSIGWSTRLVGGETEDFYFMSVKNDADARLRDALATASATQFRASELLPSEAYSVTRYATRDPLAAWRGLNFSISSQLDPVLAVMVAPFLKAALRPYGIEEPDAFLQAIGNEITTARLDSNGNSTVLIVEARDEKVLKDFVAKRFEKSKPQTEQIGDAELLSSADEERGAASFVAGHMLFGAKQAVRRCLVARQKGQTLAASSNFKQAVGIASAAGSSHTITFTADEAPARDFITFIARQRVVQSGNANQQELEKSLRGLPYAVSETQLVEGGIERRTRSAFGQLGVIATQFSTRN